MKTFTATFAARRQTLDTKKILSGRLRKGQSATCSPLRAVFINCSSIDEKSKKCWNPAGYERQYRFFGECLR